MEFRKSFLPLQPVFLRKPQKALKGFRDLIKGDIIGSELIKNFDQFVSLSPSFINFLKIFSLE